MSYIITNAFPQSDDNNVKAVYHESARNNVGKQSYTLNEDESNYLTMSQRDCVYIYASVFVSSVCAASLSL